MCIFIFFSGNLKYVFSLFSSPSGGSEGMKYIRLKLNSDFEVEIVTFGSLDDLSLGLGIERSLVPRF